MVNDARDSLRSILGSALPGALTKPEKARLSDEFGVLLDAKFAALSGLIDAIDSSAYQGTWNASTNSPTLVSGDGVNGAYYIVATAGSTTLDGISSWAVGDRAIFNDTDGVWQKVTPSSFDSDVLALKNRLWAGVLTTSKPIILDARNYYGGGANAIYVPRLLYIRQGAVTVNATATNTEATELAGYCKLTGFSQTVVNAVVYNTSTNTLSLRVYSNPGSGFDLDLDPELTTQMYVLATLYNGARTGVTIDDTSVGVAANECPYGKGFAADMPLLFSASTIGDVTESNLLALGFTKGVVDTTATNRPFYGMEFGPHVDESYLFFRCYVQTDTDNDFGIPNVYLLNSSGGFTTLTGRYLSKTLSARASCWEWVVRMPAGNWTYYYIGADKGAGSSRRLITGVQHAISRNKVTRILFDDYPSPEAAISESDFAARDAGNIALARSYADRVVTGIQRPTADYVGMFVTGQSLAQGYQTQFALSTTSLYGNVMLGGNALPDAEDGETYGTFTPGDEWVDLEAIPADDGTLYTNSTSPDEAVGEPWNHGWLNSSKALFNDLLLVENDPRIFATWNVAIPGKTIEQLSKVNTQDATDRFSRLTDAIDRAVDASTGSSLVISSVAFGQGEWDYSLSAGSTNRTRALYKAALDTYFDDIKDEILARVPGQTKGPLFLSYVTGASFTVDTDADGDPDLFVAMAQLELAQERPDMKIVGPIYQLLDKGGHLTANGSRMYANLLAKVQHRVQHLGQDWSPLRPLRVELISSQIFIDFLVPEPPLVFDTAYVIRNATTYAQKGFKVIDLDNSNASVPVTVDIVGNTIIRLTLSGSYSTNLAVYYADKSTHNGNGNLRDSDPWVSHDSYVYDAGYMPVGDNIPALVGKPYPNHNWCVPFYLPVGYGV